MSGDITLDRRTVLYGAGSLVAAGSLAGCSDGGDGNGGGNGDGNGNGGNGGDGNGGNGGNGNGGGNEEIDTWLEDAPNYDGNVEDMTGEDSVNVGVGDAEGNGDFVMDPAAIRVDSGTTVTWEWVDGDSHSVTDDGGAFDSDIQQGEGNTFEHQFDEAGTFLYYCIPHQSLGQKGAVIVE